MTIIELARRAIEHYLQTGQLLPAPADVPAGLLNRHAGAFVSLHQPNDELRGCIGTITPSQPNLAAEIIANAVAAAARDPRFSPVDLREMTGLTLSVDILTPPAPAPNLNQLDPQRQGIIVSAADGRQGVLLPNLKGVTTAQEQIAICRQKANIAPDEPVTIAQFEVKRYEAP